MSSATAVTVPVVPTIEALTGALAGPGGIKKLIQDLYQVSANTSKGLDNHIGLSTTSHEDLETSYGKLAAGLDNVEKVAEATMTGMNTRS